MKKFKVSQLMIEMTRKCTMMCDHCLRGEQEKRILNMNDAFWQALNQMEYIGQIIFTGGEPLLEARKIIRILDHIMSMNIPCGGFYIATNGTVFHRKLMNKLCEFTQYCSHHADIDPFDDDSEMSTCRVDISKTPYHDKDMQTNDFKFGLYRFVHLRKDCDDEDWLIPEGRAYENGFGDRRKKLNPSCDKSALQSFYLDEDDTIDMLYINCNGRCFSDCDLSYTTQENWISDSDDTIPDINRDIDLITQIKNYNEILEN